MLTEAPTFPGIVIRTRLIGVVRVSENGKKGKRRRNDRLIGVPVDEERTADGCRTAEDLPERMRQEIEQFFLNTTLFTQKDARVVPVLVRILEESDPFGGDHAIVLETLGALSRVGDDQAVPALSSLIRRKKFLGDHAPQVGKTAIASNLEVRDCQALATLLQRQRV